MLLFHVESVTPVFALLSNAIAAAPPSESVKSAVADIFNQPSAYD